MSADAISREAVHTRNEEAAAQAAYVLTVAVVLLLLMLFGLTMRATQA
jgi:thiosulfate reductase cytochrome b subunit